MLEYKNKIDEGAPLEIIQVENGYKVVQSRGASPDHNWAYMGEYVFINIEDAFNFIRQHFIRKDA